MKRARETATTRTSKSIAIVVPAFPTKATDEELVVLAVLSLKG